MPEEVLGYEIETINDKDLLLSKNGNATKVTAIEFTQYICFHIFILSYMCMFACMCVGAHVCVCVCTRVFAWLRGCVYVKADVAIDLSYWQVNEIISSQLIIYF